MTSGSSRRNVSKSTTERLKSTQHSTVYLDKVLYLQVCKLYKVIKTSIISKVQLHMLDIQRPLFLFIFFPLPGALTSSALVSLFVRSLIRRVLVLSSCRLPRDSASHEPEPCSKRAISAFIQILYVTR